MSTWVLEQMQITGPWGSAICTPTRIEGGFAPEYNTMSAFVVDSPVSAAAMEGHAVTLAVKVQGGALNGIFLGIVRRAERVETRDGHNTVFVECDGGESTADLDFCDTPRATLSDGWVAHFNAKGRPNKDAASAAFSRAADAVFWTAADAIEAIRDNYMVRSTWTITDEQIAAISALTRTLKPLDVRGMRILPAIAEILEQVGCRMAFRYASGSVEPVIFGEDGVAGETWAIHYKPDTEHPREIYDLRIGYDARKTTPTMYAISGNVIGETTYDTAGVSPLLTGYASQDPDYKWEYRVNPDNYAAALVLGPNLGPTERPYPILRYCNTRRSAAGTYYSAAQVTADPEIGEPVPVEETLRIYSATDADWRRLVGGYKAFWDSEEGCVIRVKRHIHVAADSANAKPTAWDTETINSGSVPRLQFTGAAETAVIRQTTLNTYGGTSSDRDGILNTGLRPRKRYNCVLPDATPNAWTTYAATEELYQDVDTEILEQLQGVYVQRGRRGAFADILLPFVGEEIPLGAPVSVVYGSGVQPLGEFSGREIVMRYSWDLESLDVRVTLADSFDQGEARLSGADVRELRRQLRSIRSRKRHRRSADYIVNDAYPRQALV